MPLLLLPLSACSSESLIGSAYKPPNGEAVDYDEWGGGLFDDFDDGGDGDPTAPVVQDTDFQNPIGDGGGSLHTDTGWSGGDSGSAGDSGPVGDSGSMGDSGPMGGSGGSGLWTDSGAGSGGSGLPGDSGPMGGGSGWGGDSGPGSGTGLFGDSGTP
jgi:hypothetical protein